jgi:FtsH-binding integral membrane protein
MCPQGVLVGAASSHARTDAVLIAFGLTAGITTAMALWALTTKHDITTAGAALYSCLLGLLFTSLVAAFVRTSLVNTLLAGSGAVLFSIYIAYDVQLLLGGSHRFSGWGEAGRGALRDLHGLLGLPLGAVPHALHTSAAVSPDEYVMAAISIYLDILNLFLHILRMLSDRN